MKFNIKFLDGDYDKNGIFKKDKTSLNENEKFIKYVKSKGINVDIFRGREDSDLDWPKEGGLNAQIGILGKDKKGWAIDMGRAGTDFKTLRGLITQDIKDMIKEGRIY